MIRDMKWKAHLAMWRMRARLSGIKMCDADDFLSDDRGLGTIEIVLILVVLIGLVIVFKREISSLLNSIFDSVDTQAGTIYK